MASKTKWTPDFVLRIVKEILGSGTLDKDESKDGRIVIKLGKDKTYSVEASFLEFKEERRGHGAAIQTIVRSLKVFDENASYDTTLEEAVKDRGKRKLGDKAEAVDQALDMAGSSSKEKNEILKNV